jgi:tripartite-type tricarboxylate transporter receptor subunit TctC
MTQLPLPPSRTRRCALQSIAGLAAALALPAWAAWPDKPIRIVVTFPPGGASDIVARVIYGELMKKELGLNLVHVPYRGGAPMTTDLISGVIPIGIDVLTAYLPFFKSGQLVPLAVTSATRSPLVPDVPSVAELRSYRKLVLDNFFGISGPAKMPADVVARINTATNEVLAQPDIRKRMLDLGISVTPGTPATIASYVKEQVNALAPTVKGAGVKL